MPETHSQNLEKLRDAQSTDRDNREKVREADMFVNKRDGQWDPYIVNRMGNKPRYTFDHCNAILDDIIGEMEAQDFAAVVSPNGGGASEKDAKLRAGMIRNLQSQCKAKYVYKDSARVMVGTGLDGWRVKTGYREDFSFQQDLLIEPVSDFKNRVFYDVNATKRTMEDADHCWVLTAMSLDAYEKMFPEGSQIGVGDGRPYSAYWQKRPHEILIAEYLYKKAKQQKLVRMTNGAVYEVNDDFMRVKDELFARGVVVHGEREATIHTVHQKFMDGGGWLTDAKSSVFDLLPVIPVFANFVVSEHKVVYWGLIEKLMDPQRVLNFAESRKVEEAALTPREKVWMTKEQAESDDVVESLRTANTNMDSHQLYDHVADHPAPFRMPKAEANGVLIETAMTAEKYMKEVMPQEARGQSPAARSGFAMTKLIDKSNTGNAKYYTAMEIAVGHTCRILNNALPKVYDTRQTATLMNQDGSTQTVTLYDRVLDEQTSQIVELNDLNKGAYNVACEAGPAYSTKQQETVASVLELAAVVPDVAMQGADILVSNMKSPGMEQLAERLRLIKIKAGEIPESQLTDDEKEFVAQLAQQNSEPSAVDKALIAEADARTREVEAKIADVISKVEERQASMELKQKEALVKAQQNQEKLDSARTQQFMDALMQQSEQLKLMADTLKTLKEAQSVEPLTNKQSGLVSKSQARVDKTGTSPNDG